MTKLNADHDQLEARVRRPQGDEQSAHTLPEQTQGESHPRRTGNTSDNLSLFHMHRPAGRTIRYRGRHTLRVEVTQSQAMQCDNRPRRASGRLPDTDKPLHQQRCDSTSCLPYIPQESGIDLIR